MESGSESEIAPSQHSENTETVISNFLQQYHLTSNTDTTDDMAPITRLFNEISDVIKKNGNLPAEHYALETLDLRHGQYLKPQLQKAWLARARQYNAAFQLILDYLHLRRSPPPIPREIKSKNELLNYLKACVETLHSAKVFDSQQEALEELSNAEHLINWQKPRKTRVTTLFSKNERGYTIVQIDKPEGALTLEQQIEYTSLVNEADRSEPPPRWFSALHCWEQKFWRQQITTQILSHTLPSTKRRYPGQTNQYWHGFLAFQKRRRTRSEAFRVLRLRSSIIIPNDIPDEEEQLRLGRQNALQVLAIGLPPLLQQYKRDFTPYDPAHYGEKIVIPILFQTLIGPLYSSLERFDPHQEASLLRKKQDVIEYVKTRLDHYRNSDTSSYAFEIIDTNYNVDLRRNWGGPHQINDHMAETMLNLLCRYLALTPYYLRVADLSSRAITHQFIGALKAHAPLNLESECVQAFLNLSFKRACQQKPQLIIHLYFQYTTLLSRQKHLTITTSRPRLRALTNLILASLEELLINLMGGLTHASCYSGKDRRGMQLMFEDAILWHFVKFKKLPPLQMLGYPMDNGSRNDEQQNQFITSCAQLFLSAHHMSLAEDNAAGCCGLKSIENVLPNNILAQIKRQVPYKVIDIYNKIASLNRLEIKFPFRQGHASELLPEDCAMVFVDAIQDYLQRNIFNDLEETLPWDDQARLRFYGHLFLWRSWAYWQLNRPNESIQAVLSAIEYNRSCEQTFKRFYTQFAQASLRPHRIEALGPDEISYARLRQVVEIYCDEDRLQNSALSEVELPDTLILAAEIYRLQNQYRQGQQTRFQNECRDYDRVYRQFLRRGVRFSYFLIPPLTCLIGLTVCSVIISKLANFESKLDEITDENGEVCGGENRAVRLSWVLLYGFGVANSIINLITVNTPWSEFWLPIYHRWNILPFFNALQLGPFRCLNTHLPDKDYPERNQNYRNKKLRSLFTISNSLGTLFYSAVFLTVYFYGSSFKSPRCNQHDVAEERFLLSLWFFLGASISFTLLFDPVNIYKSIRLYRTQFREWISSQPRTPTYSSFEDIETLLRMAKRQVNDSVITNRIDQYLLPLTPAQNILRQSSSSIVRFFHWILPGSQQAVDDSDADLIATQPLIQGIDAP